MATFNVDGCAGLGLNSAPLLEASQFISDLGPALLSSTAETKFSSATASNSPSIICVGIFTQFIHPYLFITNLFIT
jgi:hypothetical protein